MTLPLPEHFHMQAVCYLLVKFLKQTVLNLTKLSHWEADSIIKISLRRILNRSGNIVIVWHRENSKMPIPISKLISVNLPRCIETP